MGATIFLKRPQPIDSQRLLSATRAVLDGAEAATSTSGDGGPTLIITHGDMLTIVPMGFPYPVPLQQQAQFAHFWPTAVQDIAGCADHVMVFCAWSKLPRVDAHYRHLAVVEALLKQLPAAGVLWGSALTPTHTFLQLSGNISKGPPTQLWVLLQYSQQANGNALVSTIGMRDLGLMEIETDSPVPIDVAYDTVLRVASAAIAAKADLPANTAINSVDGKAWTTRTGRSFRPDVPDQVIWLEAGAPRRRGMLSRLLGGA